MIQIKGRRWNAAKDGAWHRSRRDYDYRSQRGCTRVRRVFYLGRTMKARKVSITPPRAPGAPPCVEGERGTVLGRRHEHPQA
jgi:hypothetical protein